MLLALGWELAQGSVSKPGAGSGQHCRVLLHSTLGGFNGAAL